jgi:hypothetical protein
MVRTMGTATKVPTTPIKTETRRGDMVVGVRV